MPKQEAATQSLGFSTFFTRIVDIKCVDKGEVDSTTHENQNAVNKVTAKAQKWFKFFDKDGDNSISPEELKSGLSQLNLFLDDQELSFLVLVRECMYIGNQVEMGTNGASQLFLTRMQTDVRLAGQRSED